MSYEFTKLGAVEALTEMPENANALVEVDGAIKRVPASAGGSVCIVNVSCETADMQTFTNVTKDKTFAEMDAAYNAGGLVWGRLSVNSGGMIIKCEAPLGMCMEEEGVKGMMFFPFGFFGDAGVVIRVNEDDSCSVYIE